MTYYVEFINNENRSYQVSKERSTMMEAYRDFEAISRVIPETHLNVVSVEKSNMPLQKPEEEDLPF